MSGWREFSSALDNVTNRGGRRGKRATEEGWMKIDPVELRELKPAKLEWPAAFRAAV